VNVVSDQYESALTRRLSGGQCCIGVIDPNHWDIDKISDAGEDWPTPDNLHGPMAPSGAKEGDRC